MILNCEEVNISLNGTNFNEVGASSINIKRAWDYCKNSYARKSISTLKKCLQIW